MEKTKNYIDIALSLGVHKAVLIEIKDILFNPKFRKYCEENLCGFYNKNLMCPPDIGTTEEVINLAKSYKYGIFYQTKGIIKDYSDKNGILHAANMQNNIAQKMKKALNNIGIKNILSMSTHCKYCDRCAKVDNKPCHHPELAIGCLSAYCIDVQDLAEKYKMDYNCSEQVILHFGLTLFNEN